MVWRFCVYVYELGIFRTVAIDCKKLLRANCSILRNRGYIPGLAGNKAHTDYNYYLLALSWFKNSSCLQSQHNGMPKTSIIISLLVSVLCYNTQPTLLLQLLWHKSTSRHRMKLRNPCAFPPLANFLLVPKPPLLSYYHTQN